MARTVSVDVKRHCVISCHFVRVRDGVMNDKRVSGAEQEYSLSKAKPKHGGAWSPDGWVTVERSHQMDG